MIAATTTYAVISLLNLANWMPLTIEALIYPTAYMITAPLIGAINIIFTQNKELTEPNNQNMELILNTRKLMSQNKSKRQHSIFLFAVVILSF
jgi:Mlc titration factor MtfA (ptsG expression regulator)